MKKYILRCLLLVVLLLPSTGFCNARWEYVCSNDSNSAWYIDVNSVSRSGTTYASDGSSYLFTTSQRSTDGGVIVEDSHIVRIDMMWLGNDRNNTMQILYVTSYGRRGEIIWAGTGERNTTIMSPGSIPYKLFKAAVAIYNSGY